MTTSQATRHDLGDVLGDSLTSIRDLKTTLADERRALESQDGEALSQALDRKQVCVTALARLEQRRQQICTDAGFDGDAGGMLACADWCDETREVHDQWRAFCDVARDCDQLNLANGAAIRLRQQQIADNLALLRGSTPDTDTYGPTGTATSGAGRALTEA